MTRVLLLLLAVVGVCSGQQTFEIRGTVTEPGLGGIAGVQIIVVAESDLTSARIDPATGAVPQRQIPRLQAFTDARGDYTVRVTSSGRYQLNAIKDGYIVTAVHGTTGTLSLDAENPKQELSMEMIRMAQITGRVVDDATGEPLEGIRVLAQILGRSVDGARTVPNAWAEAIPASLLDESRVRMSPARPKNITDSRGSFELTVRPGSYVVTVGPMTPAAQFTSAPEAAKQTDEDYPSLYWPGGVPGADVRAMSLGSGAAMNLGEMRIRKAARYSVRITLPQGECPQGESVRLGVARTNPDRLRPAEVQNSGNVHRCGGEVLVRGLEPGVYSIYAVSDWQGERDNVEGAVWGRGEFTIEKENAEVTVDLRRGAVLEGRFTAAEGASGLPDSIPLAVRPRSMGGENMAREQFIETGEKGRFRLAVGFGEQRLEAMTGFGAAYVSKIVFNGAPVSGSTLNVQSNGKQQLEIELDNKVGTIEGTAPKQVRTVMLWRNAEVSPRAVPVTEGAFRVPVPPGEYRMALVEDPWAVINPDAATFGEKVIVKADETVKVSVR